MSNILKIGLKWLTPLAIAFMFFSVIPNCFRRSAILSSPRSDPPLQVAELCCGPL